MNDQSGVDRLIAVMHRLRAECPWDADQTHRSLVPYLIEECLEVVEAIEAGSDADLREELGDLLLQVVFHAEIAAEQGRFAIGDVAEQIADKLVSRHPYVFADSAVPDDLMAAWEQRKRAEKGRVSSLDGIPEQLSALSRAAKVVDRATHHGQDVTPLVVGDGIGNDLLRLVLNASAQGVDPEQELRDAVRRLEGEIRHAEQSATVPDATAGR